jgi:ABC-type multidrug transport system fused ATPase/permease subunit
VFVVSTAFRERAADGQSSYAEAGSIAEQAISSIRTVVAFGGQPRETKRYEKALGHAYTQGVRKGIIAGLGIGSMMFIIFASYGLAFWYGATLIRNGQMNGGEVLSVFFALIIGAVSLG